ncbi:MAG: UDP-glucose/GDP-mannose dehydrogenase family protein [Verrucomicrobiae bacterium]|nr:UDP-glucose/GDP-mannose dehydrogenase family protein [Verrucomicrobiae bacterium]
MRISVFGLGYVGTVVLGSFALDGHHLIGVDVEPAKINLVNSGKSPIVEHGLEELISEGVKLGRITATDDHHSAVLTTDVSMICVGTPTKYTGEVDFSYLLRVAENIGKALKDKNEYHLVVIRSTILPGTCEEKIIPILEKYSLKKCGTHFGVATNPEFLREGSAVKDFFNPPMTIIGVESERDYAILEALYQKLPAKIYRTSIRTAEMLKFACNAFHALKITFTNEMGAICKQYGIDAGELMELFCKDEKLNISPAYLKPGFAFGGSCLPKDLRALVRAAQNKDVEVPLLRSISVSNELQIKNAFNLINSKEVSKIGVLGFAFKDGTDDLRESPVVMLIEMLIGRGYELKLFDRHVSLSRLMGKNRKYIEEKIPHISRLMVESPQDLIRKSQLIVIGNEDEEFHNILNQLSPDQYVIDLRPAGKNKICTPAKYERING